MFFTIVHDILLRKINLNLKWRSKCNKIAFYELNRRLVALFMKKSSKIKKNWWEIKFVHNVTQNTQFGVTFVLKHSQHLINLLQKIHIA